MPHHPPKKRKNYEWLFILFILAVAFLFRFQNITTAPAGLHVEERYNTELARQARLTDQYRVFYGATEQHNGREGLFINIGATFSSIFHDAPWSLRILSAVAGLITVLGLYKLARLLFGWQIASIASFLLAISFWHVLFSRLAVRATLAPLFIVWAFYYLWRAKQTHRMWHFGVSGLFWGLGVLSYTGFLVMFVVLILVMAVYWVAVQKHYWHARYVYLHHNIIRGFVLILILILIVSLPLVIHYYEVPEDFSNKFEDSPEGFFAGSHSLGQRFLLTFNMFLSNGDQNWLHNIPGMPALFWPLAILFLIGLGRAFLKFVRLYDEHGHFSTAQTLVLSWFFVGLVPTLWAGATPNSQVALIVAPVVFIFVAQGLWYVYEFIKKWYVVRDKHEVAIHSHHLSEGALVGTITIVIFLAAIAIYSYQTYFDVWIPLVEQQKIFTQAVTPLQKGTTAEISLP